MCRVMTTDGGAPPHDRELDLVLFGATGFTGRLVAEVLLEKKVGVRWALAGRSRDKLERIRAELAAAHPSAADLPLIVGDSLDPASVEAMVRRTRVVCTTVGPYGRYGRPLVAACAEHGVHYCDLTGEVLFIRANIEQNHDRAVATGARLVHCCGFDAIPSDLGVLTLHEHFKARGKRLAEAHLRVLKLKGGASGGTIASALEMLLRDPAKRAAFGTAARRHVERSFAMQRMVDGYSEAFGYRTVDTKKTGDSSARDEERIVEKAI